MNIFSYRPNLLFLIWIRNKHPLFILNHKLNRKLYYQKLIIALTTKETGNNGVGCAFITWKLNGKKHKDDGPAIIGGISNENPNGVYHTYYQNGKLHRGPSQDGKVGPARIYGISKEHPNGTKHDYFQHGILVSPF